MVRVGVAEVDRGRTDPSSMVLIIVQVLKFTADEVSWKYRLASPRGVMKALYARPYLIPTRSALDPTQLGFACQHVVALEEQVAVACSGTMRLGSITMDRCPQRLPLWERSWTRFLSCLLRQVRHQGGLSLAATSMMGLG